jgi:hypothetical protein
MKFRKTLLKTEAFSTESVLTMLLQQDLKFYLASVSLHQILALLL